ncbi:MAG: phosphate acetyltransferase [Christensenellales bacterium]
MSKLLEAMKKRAILKNKRIVLPEGEEIRVIKAAEMITKERIASITLLGDIDVIKSKCPDVCLDNIRIVNPKTSDKLEEYATLLYELRKSKGLTSDKARELATDNLYYGTLMLKAGEVDGMVAGSINATSDTLRPALQIIKAAPGIKTVSSFFLMVMPDDRAFIYSDCGLNPAPDSEQLADIAITSARTRKDLILDTPRIAMLSYSTKGSAKHESIDKVINATGLVRQRAPGLIIDGELQVDAALVPEVQRLKAPGSPVEGMANVLIFPDLNSGNIAYKLTQRLGNAIALGPVCQGLDKPVNDLSRGCTAEDIVFVVVITVLQTREG